MESPWDLRRQLGQRSDSLSQLVRFVQPALVNGSPGLVVAQRGRLWRALTFKIVGEKIVEAEVIMNPERLRQLDLAVLGE